MSLNLFSILNPSEEKKKGWEGRFQKSGKFLPDKPSKGRNGYCMIASMIEVSMVKESGNTLKLEF